MPYGMTLWRPAYVSFNGNKLTDHNRSEVSQSVERIGGNTRTARGSLRQYYVADKHSFSMSWDMIPGSSTKTADGFWAADDIIAFYFATTGTFTLGLVTEELDAFDEYIVDDYTVLFNDFEYNVEKRWDRYFYNVSLDLEEV